MTTDKILALGKFRFSVRDIPNNTITHESEFRWEAQQRLGRRPAMQFAGAGEERIIIDGVIYPHYTGGFDQVEDMRDYAAKGRPLSLVSGYGRVFGQFCILAIGNHQEFFMPDGSPQKVEFSIELAHYGPDGGGGFSGFLSLF